MLPTHFTDVHAYRQRDVVIPQPTDDLLRYQYPIRSASSTARSVVGPYIHGGDRKLAFLSS
jgi:hypothetical protein